MKSSPHHGLAPVLLALAIVAAYAAGLRGPFVLDDHVNLAPIWTWLAGQKEAWQTAIGNRSGPTGRPLAYLSLMLNAQLGGSSPWGFKLVNVGVHLANAWLVLLLLRRIMPGDARFAAWPAAALSLTAIWALHPMQVSTVLYVVQRMALLGAMAQLAAVLVYISGRSALDSNPGRARVLLFLVFPATMAVGLLAKETAVLAPLLCATLEFTLFADRARPRMLRVFLLLFVAIPVVMGVAMLVGGRFDAGYVAREFTLAERLLTQPRVLADMAFQWLWPSRLALYRDGFVHSQGWLLPAATVVTIFAWMALVAMALWRRRRFPLFAFGVFWFFAAHALEAGPIALEPYFEHRNYLASLGLVLAVFGLLAPVAGWFATGTGRVAVLVLCGILAGLTAMRSHTWGSLDRLLANESPPPGEISRRLQVDRAIHALDSDNAAARTEALAVLATGNAGDRAAAALWQAIFACDIDRRLQAVHRDALRAHPPSVLTHSHVTWLHMLSRRVSEGRCAGTAPHELLDVIDAWESAARHPLPGHALQQLPQMRKLLEADAVR